MRFKSEAQDGIQVFAVSGTNTVSFALSASPEAKEGLLGFSVERKDPGADKPRRVPGYKVFRSVIPDPKPEAGDDISTWDHPVQAFVWDDFTGKPGLEYEYFFHPFRGTPGAPERATPIRIKVRTEELYSGGEHDIFFNRGVAGSQAYTRRFGNQRPDKLPPERQKAALQWLSRDLDEALLQFINRTKKGDGLLCCFYEFRYPPVVEALKLAIDREVDVRIIVDAKVNERIDKNGDLQASFPRTENLKMIEEYGIAAERVIRREANPNEIQHNKFMVYLEGDSRVPTEVWTGSTNVSYGGVTGQTNVGHWVRNPKVAEKFTAYWNLLAEDPGSAKGDRYSDSIKKKKLFRTDVEALGDVPDSPDAIAQGITPIFSPRRTLDALELYGTLLDAADVFSCATLAFGINKDFKELLRDNTSSNHIVFLLLEKEDRPNDRSKDPFVAINASNNVYKAWGSYLEEPAYQWARETNARALKINEHVSYIHSKFLLADPLGTDPIVVTGSANFSEASTTGNDENMLIIRGNRRVADIYFTEFNRLFYHYYFRAVTQSQNGDGGDVSRDHLFLDETGREWVKAYEPGRLRAKRVDFYARMEGFETQT